MKRALSLGLSWLAVVSLTASLAQAATPAPSKSLGTITGTVKDHKGNPLVGAVVSLLREGAKHAKEARTDDKGNFIAKVMPGKYGITAVANGFGAVIFSSVEVRASQELVYKFNLEPVGYGNTLPERRRDRDDVKWTLRSSQPKRSIFQVDEGVDSTVQAVNDAQAQDAEIAEAAPMESAPAGPVDSGTQDSRIRTRGVLETYFASNAYGASYPGLNFALATPITENVELIFSGQTGLGEAPERFEATTRIRIGDRHRVGVTASGLRFETPVWTSRLNDEGSLHGQLSLRAVDEWIVRDGIVIVMGLDYSRFIGAGDAQAFTPRFGVQYDVNASTRMKAAFASGGDEDGIQSVATFEDEQVVFRGNAVRPVAFVDGQAILDRSHRLEFGIERVLDNSSNVEATAFFDTTSGRGVGLMSFPGSAFSGSAGDAFLHVANQQGSSRGMRVVYTRRLNRVWTASAGYAFGRGQRLSAAGFSTPAELFENGLFQTAALQLGAGFDTGTQVRTVLRFSPEATVFAIDPFAGRLGVYDPSLSIQVTQELPSFGLPVRAEAILDARNILDAQVSSENGDVLTFVGNSRRSVRGGISVRF
ncbi:MAG TPA: carboxypeptidase-like regulatory domain-containing protein [Pyrinomonadaceae bacterium]|nr:carboxypeptidase-like regulatory domain-containing protein [Pyrinomonadaceae bacterium]